MKYLISWLAKWLHIEEHEIARRGLNRYMTRWVLLGQRYGSNHRGKVYLHLFHNGDPEDYLHDHPWPFWSLILWGGYWEHTEKGRRWYAPFSLLSRPATWRHRVEVPKGRRCWTIVWCGPKERSWGFWCSQIGFVGWREHDARQNATGNGCE